jgi:uncharacterized membrane protein
MPKLHRRAWRIIASRRRLFFGVACGLLTGLLLPDWISPIAKAIIAWDTGVLIYLVAAMVLFAVEPTDRMAAHAEAQQEGEWTIFWLTVAAVMFSFAAIFGEFAGTHDLPPRQKTLHIALVAVTLFQSWLMTHTSFAFRYAHEYYSRDIAPPELDRGLIFPDETMPDYFDFMYFSLVLGMTFQVSDVQITSRKFRRLAAVHGLLSFLFNTIILALTVNIAAGLV